ncbi:MAG: hypothetical protein P4L83_15560 [Nevskia sp.]|nr:hypothetical protein [Nevskia sp.]
MDTAVSLSVALMGGNYEDLRRSVSNPVDQELVEQVIECKKGLLGVFGRAVLIWVAGTAVWMCIVVAVVKIGK